MVIPLLPFATFPDVWYDPNVTAAVGTASWVVAGLATAYFVLRWLKNTDKFYAARKKAESGMGGMR